MSKQRKMVQAFGLLGAATAMAGSTGKSLGESSSRISDEDILRLGKKRDERIEEMYPERCEKAGLKLFIIDGQEVWALNERNARRRLGLPCTKKKKSPKYSNDYSQPRERKPKHKPVWKKREVAE